MASYPAFGQLLNGSSHEVLDDIQIDRATDGSGYARSLYAGLQHRFVVRHLLNAADYATLVDFYDDNKLTPFDFTWTGAGGSSAFTNLAFEAPLKFAEAGRGWVSVEARLVTL